MNIEMNTLEIGVKRINLVGRLDLEGTAQVANTFTIFAATEKSAVLIDMSGVDFIASIGMQMLVKEASALFRRGEKMGLLQPTPPVEQALRTAGIDQIVPIYADADSACTALLAEVKLNPTV
ncbi:MAG: STAS domain-containing protein [Anaerolineae bacterium]|nr:STAS domain-containing protein [Anaerolineae bacterium]